MLNVTKKGVILEKRALEFESEGVLNPAVILENGFIHLFYRAIAKGNVSSIGFAKLKNPLSICDQKNQPVLYSEFVFEEHGIEDPRIVKIDTLFYLTYSAYDGVNALGALATSNDLINWKKEGIIVPQMCYATFKRLTGIKSKLNEKYQRYNEHDSISKRNGKKVLVWDKNVVFFPRRINGKLYFLHRIKPDIQIVIINEVTDLNKVFWQNYLLNFKDYIVLTPKYSHEISYIGAGCPPIETKAGWVLIYHGVHDSIKGFVYVACAALLDLENPQKEIARLPFPLFKSDLAWEKKGAVNPICFPTGSILKKDILYIYYGTADIRIGCVTLNLSKLVSELLLHLVTS